jgi:hypothetical protein
VNNYQVQAAFVGGAKDYGPIHGVGLERINLIALKAFEAPILPSDVATAIVVLIFVGLGRTGPLR